MRTFQPGERSQPASINSKNEVMCSVCAYKLIYRPFNLTPKKKDEHSRWLAEVVAVRGNWHHNRGPRDPVVRRNNPTIHRRIEEAQLVNSAAMNDAPHLVVYI